ncbi:MAG: glutathione S-transferase N-terminal domain-containing protein [Parahaliea sp.]
MKKNLVGSFFSTGIRAGNGIQAHPVDDPPAKRLRLYDIENCPHCRLVREVLTELNIDVEIYPCPKGGERYLPKVIELGGKAQRPYLYDPNTDSGRYESLEIIAYLYDMYAKRRLPIKWRAGSLQAFGSSLASLPGGGYIKTRRAGRVPRKKLELYSFESSPYSRLVREELCELEIPYILRQCGRSNTAEWLPPLLREQLGIGTCSILHNRQYLLEHTGRMAVPYLYDPNTETGLYESADIIDYLRNHYDQ